MDSIEKNVNFDIHEFHEAEMSAVFNKIWKMRNNCK